MTGEAGDGGDGGKRPCRSCRMWRWGLVLTLTALVAAWAIGG